ncbi:hypothetical protein C5F59_011870 [Streptomyces sp. QL37]|nr:hypothetical protein [Streptomyces sp. QL37]
MPVRARPAVSRRTGGGPEGAQLVSDFFEELFAPGRDDLARSLWRVRP